MTTLTDLRQLALTNSGYNPSLDSATVDTLATAVVGTSVYATINDLPNSNNDSGDQALVQSNDRYYIWTDSSWRAAGLINRSPVISLSPASSAVRSSAPSRYPRTVAEQSRAEQSRAEQSRATTINCTALRV